MTGSTKILTVSYGTFSCTLEGFDDPFGTMRGIAEYFRDLAADDRYFGAEPPTPDVEMLQRIAEKEVQRRVEARLGDAGVALTQMAAPEMSEPEAPAPVADASSEVATDQVDEADEVVTARAAYVDDEDNLETGPLTHDDEYLLSDEPEDVLSVDPSITVAPEGPAETVAEKLRRIRAVVSRSIEPESDQDDSPFSDAQAPFADGPDDAPRRARARTSTIRHITEDLSEEDAADDDTAQDVVTEVEAAPAETVAADASEDDLSREVEATDDTGSDDDSGGWDFDTEGLNIAGSGDDIEDENDAADDDAPERDLTSDLVGSILSKARADEAETVEKAEPEAAGSVADDTPRSERRVSKPLTPIADEGADVGRILAETDNQLNNDESVRRRRVISQMRAAVAATKADRLVSRKVTTREDEEAEARNAYRSDLSEAVREVSRPASPGKTSERRPSIAPLVLVSSQRVADGDGGASNASDGKAPDFAGFAKLMGAKELPDLLEAAAAYTSFVEGQASFSRPEIMKRVARVDPSLQMSREDGLRSFGQLLRQGKLRKLERGQFTISDTTRFKPAERIAGE